MSEQNKPVLKYTVVRDGRSPIRLSDGTYADIYYLGEAWKEALDSLLGSDLPHQIKELRERLAIIETVIAPLTEEYLKKEILDVFLQDGKSHMRRNITLSFPDRQRTQIAEVIEKLKAEGKITESRKLLRVVEL